MKGLIGLMLITLFLVTSCRDEGPAEEMGRNIDEAAENVGDEIRDATN